MSLLGHQELSIIKGVGPTPGDTTSSEQQLVIVDLLTPNSAFALVDWTPNIPSLKSGGIWADSPIIDGRTLIAGVNTNVIETIVVQLTGSTIADYASQFAKFQRLIQDTRDYWDTFYQIEPVYIRWWANTAPGPQFALIYNIDMDVEWQDAGLAQATLTLKIEREYGWRGVRPGGNPKEWTYFKLNTPFNSTRAALTTGTDHIASQTIQNRREWNAAATAIVSQNHVEIPANKIPGDLPALSYIYAEIGGTPNLGVGGIYIARTSKPDLISTTGAIRPPNYIFNAADSTPGTDTSTAADTGAPLSGAASTALRTVTTFATATDAQRLTWNASSRGYIDFSINRGRYACFARARLSVASTVTMHLDLGIAGTIFSTPPVTFSDIGGGGVGNTTSWGLVYLGQLNIPPTEARINVDDDGMGVVAQASGSSEQLYLYAARTGVAASLYVSDIIMIPIDECGAFIAAGFTDTLSTGQAFIHDGTGYYSHGKPGAISKRNAVMNTALSGQEITLAPNAINRLHFLLTDLSGTTTVRSEIQLTMPVKVDIVPRWSSIRDA